MRLVEETRLLFVRKMLEMLRQPAWVVVGLSTPLLYLALFAPLLKPLAGGAGFPSGGDVLDVFVPGILTLMAFSAGTGAGWMVISEMESGVIERFAVTPASRFAFLMGTVLRDVVGLIVPALLIVVVAIPFGFHPHWGGIAILMPLLSLVVAITSATSSALGITLREVGSLAAIVTGMQLPLTLLSGVLLPLTLAPDWMRIAAHLNPLYYAVEASRDLSQGAIATWAVGEGFLVLCGLALLALWWATHMYRRALA